MRRRFVGVLIVAALTTACGGPGGIVSELLEQARLDDPRVIQTHQRNLEVLESDEAMPFLATALESDPSPQVRRWCVRLLGRIGNPEAVPALTAALSDDDKDVRDGAGIALLQIAEAASDDALAEDAFIDALQNGSTQAKLLVLIELENMKSVKAIGAITELARSASPLVSKPAADALGGIGDAAACAPLAEIALDAGMPADLRRSAIMNLGRIDDPVATMSLQQVVDGLGEQEGADALTQLARDTMQ